MKDSYILVKGDGDLFQSMLLGSYS